LAEEMEQLQVVEGVPKNWTVLIGGL
jgi:hypothetical protein